MQTLGHLAQSKGICACQAHDSTLNSQLAASCRMQPFSSGVLEFTIAAMLFICGRSNASLML